MVVIPSRRFTRWLQFYATWEKVMGRACTKLTEMSTRSQTSCRAPHQSDAETDRVNIGRTIEIVSQYPGEMTLCVELVNCAGDVTSRQYSTSLCFHV